jgi:poly-gamma-glutamate synthesis protein (capsule biosynthesis protein)
VAVVTLFLAGDVMTGRGIDQALPSPGSPELRESYVHDARVYVALAERAAGRIAQPLPFAAVWGAALPALERAAPDARIVNLETSVTTADSFWPGKGIHYRMSPANVGCLTAAALDCCTLANNHVLDFDRPGLDETLATLHAAGLRTAGAGADAAEAEAPAVLELPARRARVLVLACGAESSGIPAAWAATARRSGVHRLERVSAASAAPLAAAVGRVRRPGDVVVVSVHWGGNWGYAIPPAHRELAHALIDGGVDVVYGHSSHHAVGIEVYRGRPILYGCGDCVNDYEGIAGYERYRPDLAALYFAAIDSRDGSLEALKIVVLRRHALSLVPASRADVEWLAAMFEREGRPFGTRAELTPDGDLELRYPPGA